MKLFNLASRIILLLLSVALVGCATHKIDWSGRVGTYTFDQAVIELGPPDKQAKLTDGTVVAEWLTYRGYAQTYYGPAYANRSYGFLPPSTTTTSPDYFLRLTFDPAGKLAAWKKIIR